MYSYKFSFEPGNWLKEKKREGWGDDKQDKDPTKPLKTPNINSLTV